MELSLIPQAGRHNTCETVAGNLILNWPILLRPFKTVFSPYIDVYLLAIWFYITSSTKYLDLN